MDKYIHGATAGKFEIKSCGNAHAWCRICQPNHPQELKRLARLEKERIEKENRIIKPCRNCGKCDDCLGIEAPEGMKLCRQCNEFLELTNFVKRSGREGKYTTVCKICHAIKNNKDKISSYVCTVCSIRFTLYTDSNYTECGNCRENKTNTCPRCGISFEANVRNKRYCSAECREAENTEKHTISARNKRYEILCAYSNNNPKCVCCGDPTVAGLEIDHINGGGTKQLRELGGKYLDWFKRNNYPEGYQVLCALCNHSKGTSKECPLKEERCNDIKKYWENKWNLNQNII